MSAQQPLPNTTTPQQARPSLTQVVAPLTIVHCCYCGTRQGTSPPPSLHTCVACKHDFRVYANDANVKPIAITERARRFFTQATGTEGA